MFLFLTALLLGFIFNAAPGAVFAETIRQGIRGGFKPAFAVQVGSLVGDALWAVLGLAGVGLLLQVDFLRLPVGIAGVLYLLWLSWDAWQEANQEFSVGSNRTITHHRKALRSGILLSITNPQNIAYWAALGSAMGAVGVANPTAIDYLIFFVGFMVSSILWAFLCAGLVAQVFRNSGVYWARLTYRACAIAFLLLALSSLRNLWVSHISPQDAMETPEIHSKP
jgi:chemosensory pili system protein ChpE